ncbi:snRNA-activating protein complex subunit 1-like isoform X1 [Ochlerotatus camptorhynchus]|uniref:snRNA-activating protein complex subunit 1-like isoform X1 n=2 Tax=Ochlerotatus camptorhynchus TaxID=644619 RepID=UPI0031D64424
MVSELSRGFREDCYTFLTEFNRHESMEFRHFCYEWKRMNFQFVFYGRNTDVDMVAFVAEALTIVKQIFLSSKNPLEKIGAFYLLYTLYFKQPTERFCKIRVTLVDWREFKRFIQRPAPEQYSLEIAAIFWKMFIGDAFRFVQDELEYGYDSFFGKGTQMGRFDDKSREAFKIVKEAENDFLAMKASTGLFTALDALEMGYNEMKESLDETEPTTGSSGDKIPQSNLMQSLHKDLDALISILNTSNEAQAGDDDASDALLAAEFQSSDNIGAKRSSLRERAFRRKVHRKDLQIATASNDGVGSSTGSSRQLRPRATKKRDMNSSVMTDDAVFEAMSTDDDDPTAA